MNWDRVPVVKEAKEIGKALKPVFTKFPLWVIGYKWCCICKGRISPRDKLYYLPPFAMNQLEEDNPLCEACNGLMNDMKVGDVKTL